jgi:AhpD family alkylhydroperoxidase
MEGLVMLDKTDIDRIEKINQDFKYVHESFTSRGSKSYESYMKLGNNTMKEGSITKMHKELIAVGISAYVYCEPCITWHVREALNSGVTDEQVVEAIEVAIEMGGGPVVTRSASFAFKVLEYYKNKDIGGKPIPQEF